MTQLVRASAADPRLHARAKLVGPHIRPFEVAARQRMLEVGQLKLDELSKRMGVGALRELEELFFVRREHHATAIGVTLDVEHGLSRGFSQDIRVLHGEYQLNHDPDLRHGQKPVTGEDVAR